MIRKLKSLIMMVLRYFLNLIFWFALNVCFFLLEICLNSLVVISFCRSAKLRRKSCYSMIMVSSFYDLFAVLTDHSFVTYIVVFLLTENEYAVRSSWVRSSLKSSSAFLGLSLLALLIMNFDRYLATYYPSHLSPNICNEEKALNSFCSSGRIIFVFDISKLHNFAWTCCFKLFFLFSLLRFYI